MSVDPKRFVCTPIKGTNVYLVEKHQWVLKGWCDIFYPNERPLVLITLDNHIDTRTALNHRFSDIMDPAELDNKVVEHIKNINIQQCTNINSLIEELTQDQHIDTAIKLGYLERSYSIHLEITGSNQGNMYQIPIFDHTSFGGASELEVQKHVLDNDFLEGKIDWITSQEGNSLQDFEYILDIDCDYIHHFDSLKPKDDNVFASLVKNAKCISIARETSFVEESDREPDNYFDFYENGLTAKYIEQQLFKMIKKYLT